MNSKALTIDKARVLPVLAFDFGNGSIVWALKIDGETTSGLIPSLLLPSEHPQGAQVDGRGFVYGAQAAAINLSAAFNPGQAGSSKSKFQNLEYVLAICAIESGLVTGEGDQIDIDVRIATPLNCQIPAHEDLVGVHQVKSPAKKGGMSQSIKVRSVTSYQECRPLLMRYPGAVDCGNGTTMFGYVGASGHPTIDSINSGVGQILIDTLADPKVSARSLETAVSIGKGVLSPLGLAASLSSGRAIKPDGSVVYRGIEVGDILKPLTQRYWATTVKDCIARAAGNIVSTEAKPTIALLGGGSALVKALLPKDELTSVELPEGYRLKFLKNPAQQLVLEMANHQQA